MGVLLSNRKTSAQIAGLMIAGRHVELALTSVSSDTIRISLAPIEKKSIGDDGLLVEQGRVSPPARFRTLAPQQSIRLGNVAVMIERDQNFPQFAELLGELERIRTSQPSADELKLAKGAFSLSLAGLFETSERTAETVGDLFTYDLPLDYYKQLPAQIDVVNAADVQRVASQYVHPESAVVIVAGDRAKIEPELKKLSIGPLEVRDYEGNPIKEGPSETKPTAVK